MAFKVSSTTVVNDSALIDLSRVTLTSSVITGVSVGVNGDGANAYGSVYCRLYACSLSGNILYLTFNTDCNCICLCVC